MRGWGAGHSSLDIVRSVLRTACPMDPVELEEMVAYH